MSIGAAVKAASLAAKCLKDEKNRRTILILLITPLLLIMLLLSVVIYIITSPLEAILGGGNDTYGIEEIKKRTDVMEYSAVGNYSNITYDRNKILQGKIDVVYYNQNDSPWKNMLYGTIRTIGISGCGPTSMAIVISTFTGLEVTPAETADWSYQNGYLVQGYENGNPYAMSSHSLIPALAKEYGLSCTGISKDTNTANAIYESLSKGKLIVAIMGPGHFTSGGHFIVLSGVTKDGKILVADCASRQRTNQEWDIQTIINESKGDAGAGGPFWAIN